MLAVAKKEQGCRARSPSAQADVLTRGRNRWGDYPSCSSLAQEQSALARGRGPERFTDHPKSRGIIARSTYLMVTYDLHMLINCVADAGAVRRRRGNDIPKENRAVLFKVIA